MFQPDKLADLIAKPVAAPAPFSVESLIAWLEKKRAYEAYQFCLAEDGCLWAQYTTGMGGHFDDATNSYIIGNDSMSVSLESFTWQCEIAVGRPQTFGGALARARAAVSP